MNKQGTSDMDNWITCVEAGAILGISARHVKRLIASGQIQGRLMHGRLWLVNHDSLEGYTPSKRGRKPQEVNTE